MTIQVVERSFKIIDLFTIESPILTSIEIKNHINLPKGTTSQIIRHMVDNSLLRYEKKTKSYTLGIKIYDLEVALPQCLSINHISRPILQKLATDTGYFVRLAIWHDNKTLITMHLLPDAEQSQRIQEGFGLGPFVDTYASAVGKALLSGLSSERLAEQLKKALLKTHTPKSIVDKRILIKEIEEAKITKITYDKGELKTRFFNMGTPIYNQQGEVIAAICIGGIQGFDKILDKKSEPVKHAILKASEEISDLYSGKYYLEKIPKNHDDSHKQVVKKEKGSSIYNALQILLLFQKNPLLKNRDIFNLLNLESSLGIRYIKALRNQGFVTRLGKINTLDIKLFNLGIVLAESLKINRVGRPIAKKLAIDTKQLVRLAIWDNDTVLITSLIFHSTSESISTLRGIGPRTPAYCSSLGKAMLSKLSPEELSQYLERTDLKKYTPTTITDKQTIIKEIETIREAGISQDSDEYRINYSSIATTIFDNATGTYAAISLSGDSNFVRRPDIAELSKQLIETANKISSVAF
jgi:DNA-binding IclR family transcriptional regulator